MKRRNIMEKKENLKLIIVELRKQRNKATSPLKKEVLKLVLASKEKQSIIQNMLNGDCPTPIPVHEEHEVSAFFRKHILEIDRILLEEHTSIADMMLEYLKEIEREVVYLAIDHCLSKAIHEINPEPPPWEE
jgi:hypothetical protein